MCTIILTCAISAWHIQYGSPHNVSVTYIRWILEYFQGTLFGNKDHLLQFIRCAHSVCFKIDQQVKKHLMNMSTSKELDKAMEEVCNTYIWTFTRGNCLIGCMCTAVFLVCLHYSDQQNVHSTYFGIFLYTYRVWTLLPRLLTALESQPLQRRSLLSLVTLVCGGRAWWMLPYCSNLWPCVWQWEDWVLTYKETNSYLGQR